MADNNEQNKTTTVVTKPNSADPAVERKLREMKSHFPLKEQEAHYLLGEKDVRSTIDINKEKATIFFKDCVDSEYVIESTCARILIEDCHNCKITVNGRVMSSVIEAWKCENLNIAANTKVHTLQLDVSTNLNVHFAKKDDFYMVIWAGLHDFTMTFANDPSVLKTGVAQMKETYGAETVDDRQSQFIVRFIEGALLSERVVRLPNGYPTTEREKKIYEENQQKKEDELRKLLQMVPSEVIAKQIQQNATINEMRQMVRAKPNDPKVGRNDDCPCGSGKKYKKCCGK
jgi:hypothetical protein